MKLDATKYLRSVKNLCHTKLPSKTNWTTKCHGKQVTTTTNWEDTVFLVYIVSEIKWIVVLHHNQEMDGGKSIPSSWHPFAGPKHKKLIEHKKTMPKCVDMKCKKQLMSLVLFLHEWENRNKLLKSDWLLIFTHRIYSVNTHGHRAYVQSPQCLYV